MKLLLDVSAKKLAMLADEYPEYVGGQLLTPASSFVNAGGVFAVDNGCFKQFDRPAWERLLAVNEEHKPRCQWVCAPDVVGSGRRTLECFRFWGGWLADRRWPVALVAQDGIEDLDIPWDAIAAIFIGGTDRFKDSESSRQVAKTAKILGKIVHVGRVNAKRIGAWRGLADTGDGSGYSRFTDEMLGRLVDADRRRDEPTPLLQGIDE